MYRIRFHGRGGQGMKTASRILGTAFFNEGYEVQDAQRYGAERRGAPIFAYVRASRDKIFERGVIRDPNLVVVADDTLVMMPAAGVLQGFSAKTVLLIHSHLISREWQSRLHLSNPVYVFPCSDQKEECLAWRFIGVMSAAAAAQLTGVLPWETFASALHDELAGLEPSMIEENLVHARRAYEVMAPAEGSVTSAVPAPVSSYRQPDWIECPFEDARTSAPAIHQELTSESMKTGLWRTTRPVINRERCKACAWICSTYCPDGVIHVDKDGWPHIDYIHCKGCLVCVAQCPHHAIAAVPEKEGRV
jgi:pyruvate ferredoxin oxidoreductase gamma subunit